MLKVLGERIRGRKAKSFCLARPLTGSSVAVPAYHSPEYALKRVAIVHKLVESVFVFLILLCAGKPNKQTAQVLFPRPWDIPTDRVSKPAKKKISSRHASQPGLSPLFFIFLEQKDKNRDRHRFHTKSWHSQKSEIKAHH